MKILITGNMGYVGSVLVRHLRHVIPDSYLAGYDNAYFAHCLTDAAALPERAIDTQHFGDVRSIPDSVLRGYDAVVHLAAISNDPIGSQFEVVTDIVNHQATVDVATRAISSGVGRFVFASSCSIYGFSEGGSRAESDTLNPLTAYARSKVAAEQALANLAGSSATVTSLRFATACGMSHRLRLDLVLNDFVACAVAGGEISVLSDGTPWRPLIDVNDMARAIEWAVTRDRDDPGPYVAVNVGAEEWNFQVGQLAEAVARVVPGTKVKINTSAPSDRRSYRVDFSLYRRLAPRHQPQVSIEQTITALKMGLESMAFRDTQFRCSQFMRLKVLERHIQEGRLDRTLWWLA